MPSPGVSSPSLRRADEEPITSSERLAVWSVTRVTNAVLWVGVFALGALAAIAPVMPFAPLVAMVLAAAGPLVLGHVARRRPRRSSLVAAIAVAYASGLFQAFGPVTWAMPLHVLTIFSLGALTAYANPRASLAGGAAVLVPTVTLGLAQGMPFENLVTGLGLVALETSMSVLVALAFNRRVLALEAVVARRTTHLEAALESLKRHERRLAQAGELARLGSFEVVGTRLNLSVEAKRALGATEGITTVRAALRLFPTSSRRVLLAAVRETLAPGASFDVELPCLAPAGQAQRWVRLLGQREHTADGVRLFGAVQDASEHVQGRAAALAASHAKSQFLANMSHEVRTPLNGILGMAQLALEQERDPQQREYLQLITLSGQNLLSIVNDVLDLSRIEAGHFTLEAGSVEVRQVIDGVVRPAAFRAQTKGLELFCRVHPDVPERIETDGLRLTQVLNNLLGNALKFTLTGSVGLEVSVEGQRLKVAVRDSGIGIARDKLSAIFEPFVQADGSTNRRFGGTGLGLTISRQLARRLGGDLTVRSEPAVGSVFTLELPLVTLAPAPVVRLSSPLRVAVVAPFGELGSAVVSQLEALGAAVLRVDPKEVRTLGEVDAIVAPAEAWSAALEVRSVPKVVLARPGVPVAIRATMLTRPTSDEALAAALEPRAPAVTRLAPQVAPAPGRALRVLVAEDNAVNAKLVVRLLERMGHHAVLVGDGAEAVAQARSASFDLVLMDMQMPELDGLAATRAIRMLEVGSAEHLPIVALTANAMASDEAACLAAGMDAYLSKPLAREALAAVLERLGGAATREAA